MVDGRYQFGTYDGPIATVNPLDVAGPATSLRKPGPPVAAHRRAQGVGGVVQLGDDDWFVLGAVYDAKAVGLLQVLVVDKRNDSIRRWERKVPPPVVHVARGLSGTRSHGHTGGFTMSIGNELARGSLRVDASHPGHGELPPLELHGTGTCGPDQAGHLVVVHPFGDDRALYSHKVMMPFAGTLHVGADQVGLAADRGFLILDDHHGDYPRPRCATTGSPPCATARAAASRASTSPPTRSTTPTGTTRTRCGSAPRCTGCRRSPSTGPRVRGACGTPTTATARSTSGSPQPCGAPCTWDPAVRSPSTYAPYGWMEGTIEAQGARLGVDGMFGVGEQKLVRL